MAQQTLIVHLDEHLAREVREHLGARRGGYSSLNEFVEVALINQLAAEAAGSEAAADKDRPATMLSALAGLEPSTGWDSPGDLADAPITDETLFVLTNRLGPMKVAARALANMRGQDWPVLRDFYESAGRAARALGLRLRAEDAAERRGGNGRRWVAFPVGEDERAALDRFAFSFTISVGPKGAAGPMAVLGLANIVEGDRVALTDRGWALAAAPSPLIDGAPGSRLSDEEAQILRTQVRRAPAELAAVREFISLARRAAGEQRRLDELLGVKHSDWTADLTIAHRAAMLGRLGDLGAVEVTGRGPKARIELLPPAVEFADGSDENEVIEEAGA